MTNTSTKLLYLSGKRAEEQSVLEYLSQSGQIELMQEDPGGRFFGMPKHVLSLYLRARRFKPDIILSERIGPLSVIAVFLKKRLGAVLAIRVKGNAWAEDTETRPGSPLLLRLKRRAIRLSIDYAIKNCDAVLPVSDGAIDFVKRNTNTRKAFYRVYLPSKSLDRLVDFDKREHPVGSDGPSVITVTNFNYRLKIEPLRRAVELLSSWLDELGCQWYILGDGEYLPEFRQSLRSLENTKAIHIEGFQDPAEYYSRARAHLYFSGLDVLPNVMLESMARRIPFIVNADFPAIEFIEDGKTGLIVNLDNEAMTKNTIHGALFDSETRQRLKDCAFDYVSSHFTVQAVAEEMGSAISSIIKGR